MKNLSIRFNRFFLQHRNKGIPNLMLYIALGNAIVLIVSMLNGGAVLYDLLCFDKAKILEGQVWRLVTYVFTQSGTGFMELIFLYFFYMLGRHVEQSIGTLKFNLFYLSGVLLMDIFAMIFCPTGLVLIGNRLTDFSGLYNSMPLFLHLSLIIAFATIHSDSHFLILFIIPVKASIMALIYLALIGIQVFNLCYPVMLFPHCLFPLVGLMNYFLFFWAEIPNLFPQSWRRKKSPKSKVIHFEQQSGPYRPAPQKADYIHKCTVCGRTDTDHPDLEFRYCSRCGGYHCYCIDHINDHTHLES